MGEDDTVMLDPMAIPSPTGVSSPCQAGDAEEKMVVSLNENGTAHGTESHEARAPESHQVESVTSEEGTNIMSGGLEEEERVSENPQEDLKHETNGLENSSTLPPATDAPQEDMKQETNGLENSSTLPPAIDAPQDAFSDKPSEELEHEGVVQTQETAEHEDEAPSINIDEKEEEVQLSDVMDVIKQDEILAPSDEEHTKQEIVSSQGGDLLKQEVAHRSHIFGSLSKLDENSARQLLNDSGWNVSQSVRMNGKTQWYYRSPPPKPVLLGSLSSAVAMWKRLVDEDHKREGGGDGDLYPMVTAFLNNVKRPAAAKKRKRGRHSD